VIELPKVGDGFGVAKQKKMAHGGKLAGEARKGEWAKRGISDTPLGCEDQGAGRLGFSSSTTRYSPSITSPSPGLRWKGLRGASPSRGCPIPISRRSLRRRLGLHAHRLRKPAHRRRHWAHRHHRRIEGKSRSREGKLRRTVHETHGQQAPARVRHTLSPSGTQRAQFFGRKLRRPTMVYLDSVIRGFIYIAICL
jgi:hypothetical protein